jgi:putative exosortase-associated protein (TIGR04073 family)
MEVSTMGQGRWVGGIVMGLLLGLGIPDSLAAEETSLKVYSHGAVRKLGRGLANVVTAPLELIREPYLVSARDGGPAGLTVGVVRGLGAAVLRELTGGIEVVTFFVPFPKKDFEPLFKPEFVYAHGDWSP